MKKSKINIPNLITLFRIIAVPFFVYFIFSKDIEDRIIAFILFSIASMSDFLDGYLARKLKQESEFGKFLDPLADKFLVLGAFITFIFLSEQIEIWMVLLIIGRDVLITILRSLAIRKGTSLRTSRFAKIKTAFQMFSIIVILLSFLSITYRQRNTINQIYLEKKQSGLSTFEVANEFFLDFINGKYQDFMFIFSSFFPYYIMLLTTIITVISGLRYLYTNYQLLLPPYRKKGEFI